MKKLDRAIQIQQGDTVTLRYKLWDKNNKEYKDLTGLSFTLSVREYYGADTVIMTKTATVDTANKIFSFTFTASDTSTPMEGVYSIIMTDGGGNNLTLTVPRGAPFRIYAKI